jgi:hypothetical protein
MAKSREALGKMATLGQRPSKEALFEAELGSGKSEPEPIEVVHEEHPKPSPVVPESTSASGISPIQTPPPEMEGEPAKPGYTSPIIRVTVYLQEHHAKELKLRASYRGTTMKALVNEAMEDYFRKHGFLEVEEKGFFPTNN